MAKRKHAVERFKTHLSSVIRQHQELMDVVKNNRNQVSMETMLVEQFTMSVAVSWESFLNDLLLQYVGEQPSRFVSGLNARVKQSVKDKYGPAVSGKLRLVFRRRLTRESVQGLIDYKGENIPVTSADLLANKAGDFLPAKYAKMFSLNSGDRLFVDFVFSLRNYLSHRSARAWDVLKKSVATLDATVDKPLTAKISRVGSYLRFRTSGETRAITIAKRLIVIAESLRLP